MIYYSGLNVRKEDFDLVKEFSVGEIKYRIVAYSVGILRVYKKVGDIVTWSTISRQALKDDQCYNFWIKGVVNGDVY